MIFDAIVLLIILISAVFAFFRGFIRETLTVLGVVGGVLAALYFGPQLSPHVHGWIGADIRKERKSRAFLEFCLIPFSPTSFLTALFLSFL